MHKTATKQEKTVRLTDGEYITEGELKFREKLAKEQSKLLKKSWDVHEKMCLRTTERMNKKLPIDWDTAIKKEKRWADKDMTLRRRLHEEFNEKVSKYRAKEEC